MKHQDPEKLVSNAEILPGVPEPKAMSREERLRRWAEILEERAGELNALREIEYLSPRERRSYREANTPLTVAYNDPVFRAAGLAGDTLGDSMDFFEMSNSEAHWLLCDCHFRGTMTGHTVAYRIRHYVQCTQSGSLWQHVRNALTVNCF